jgi:hypothetical protein
MPGFDDPRWSEIYPPTAYTGPSPEAEAPVMEETPEAHYLDILSDAASANAPLELHNLQGFNPIAFVSPSDA